MITRRLIQLCSAILYNCNLISDIPAKYINSEFCVPGLNCRYCPAAVAGCPLNFMQGLFAGGLANLPIRVLCWLLLLSLAFSGSVRCCSAFRILSGRATGCGFLPVRMPQHALFQFPYDNGYGRIHSSLHDFQLSLSDSGNCVGGGGFPVPSFLPLYLSLGRFLRAVQQNCVAFNQSG